MHRLVEGTAQRIGWGTIGGQNGGTSNTNTEETGGEGLSLWDRVFGLIEQDLAERRGGRLFVEVRSESGSCRKEIGELTAEERRSLHPDLREHVVERLLDRYLAEQDRVDLADKRRAYTKKLHDLTPEDLPALVYADRQRAEEKNDKEREQAEFAWEVRTGSERLIIELAGTTGAGEETLR